MFVNRVKKGTLIKVYFIFFYLIEFVKHYSLILQVTIVFLFYFFNCSLEQMCVYMFNAFYFK
jgi:hypothetical protein